MAVRGNHGIGIPAVLFREGEGLVVTIEAKSGHTYRGTVLSTEDNMNIAMKDVTCTDPDGRITKMERIFLRGSQILFAIYPDILHNAPFFIRVAKASKGMTVAGGLGRGRQQAITAKAAKRKAEEVRNVGAGTRPPMGFPPGGPPPPMYAPRPAASHMPPPMDARQQPMMMSGPPPGVVPGQAPPSYAPPPAGRGGVGRGVDATRPAWAR